MRLAFAGLLVAGGLITTLSLGWSGAFSASRSGAEGSSWQLRELTFLKAAYDRMQQDILQQEGSGQAEASASLRAERKRIVRQMTETAKLLPIEAVPAELRELLFEIEAVPASLSGLIETIEMEAERPSPDLRVGFGGGLRPVMRTAEFAIDPELREPLRREPSAPRVPRKGRDEADRND
jgi:hypothetical protein